MNKKKFLATCTLVAFGSTMLPAFAFAAAGPTPKPTTFVDGSNGFVDVATNGFDIEFDGFEETWLTNDDRLVIKVAKENVAGSDVLEDASEKFTMSVTQKAAASSAAGKIKIIPVEGATFIPGYYAVSVIDKDGKGTSDVVVIEAPIEESTVASAAGKVTGTTIEHSDKVNLIMITNTGWTAASDTKVFDLGTKGYAQLKAGAEAIATTDGSTKEVPTQKLVEGHFYAIEGTDDTIAADIYPAVVFEYTTDVAKEVKKAVDAAQAQVDTDLAKVPNEITVAVDDDSTPIVLCGSGKTLDSNALKFADAKNKIFIASGLMVDNDQVVVADTFASGAFANATSNVVVAKAYPLVAKGDVTGTITVAVQNDDTKAIAEKEVKITLTAPKTDQETMAAYANKYLSSYNAGISKDLTDDTAALTVSAVGEGFAVTSNVTVDATKISYNLAKYFDAETGKVTKLPEKDVTEKVVLKFADPATGVITVDLTIKAAASGDKDLAAATEKLNAEIKDYNDVIATIVADNKITTEEYAQFKASKNKVLEAYQAYVDAGGQE